MPPTITAQNISDKVSLLLQDQTNIRWTEPEILGWINSAQREIMIFKPNANPTVGNLSTAAGTKQVLPAGGIQLLEIIRTVGGLAITAINRNILDVTMPDWHTQAAGPAKHYVFDERFPTVFYLFPPALVAASIEAVWSKLPTDAVALASTIFDDLYETVIIDYVMYRAYTKDSEFTGNDQRSTSHYQAFVQALTGKTQGEMMLAPVQKFTTPRVTK